jgi:hypothetical protein
VIRNSRSKPVSTRMRMPRDYSGAIPHSATLEK